MIEVKPAKDADILQFFGRSSPVTLRKALAAVENEEVIALAGVYISENRQYIFSEIKEKALKYRKRILKHAKEFMRSLPKGVYYAVADSRRDTADNFLRHLGFEQDTNLYRIEVR